MDETGQEQRAIPAGLAKLLRERDLSFREFVEWSLYDERDGYYAGAASTRQRHRDFITAPAISPIFGWTISQWFLRNFPVKGDTLSAIVDVGCGDGGLLASLARELDVAGDIGTPGGGRAPRPPIRFLGIDRSLSFVPDALRDDERLEFSTSLEAIPNDRPALVICNELFDAIPFARVVRRDTGLSEICVTLADGDRLDWSERPALPESVSYFEKRGIALEVGQFADITPEWSTLYRSIANRLSSGVILTFDYGYQAGRLFDNRIRRFGTAAAYTGHKVHRDLLAMPGQQDLTCHVNFDDLIESGEAAGLQTVSFTRLARFLLEAGGATHPLFAAPVEDDLETALEQREARENARRLLLPDGIGDEMRVLVQEKGRVLVARGPEQV